MRTSDAHGTSRGKAPVTAGTCSSVGSSGHPQAAPRSPLPQRRLNDWPLPGPGARQHAGICCRPSGQASGCASLEANDRLPVTCRTADSEILNVPVPPLVHHRRRFGGVDPDCGQASGIAGEDEEPIDEAIVDGRSPVELEPLLVEPVHLLAIA